MEKQNFLDIFEKKTNFEKKPDFSKTKPFWSLYKRGEFLPPLKFSNNKTQEDVVKEVVSLINSGKKIIFLKGVCGSGKSAIALNVARVLGKSSIVVPLKSLQRQYQEDYSDKMFLLNEKKEKLKVSIITGKDNHDSLFKKGSTCSDPFLPDNIKITEKNFNKINEYYKENKFIKNKIIGDLSKLRRISIAPANPYWSPIIPSEYSVNLPDAKQKKYLGLNGIEFTFYHRKNGCSYYDQYNSYLDSDILIFNSSKYKIETDLNRKPYTEVEIIDEADEFLDSFSTKTEINLTKLKKSLSFFYADDEYTSDLKERIINQIRLIEKEKKAVGVDENIIFKLSETKVINILKFLLEGYAFEAEAFLEENSSNHIKNSFEAAKRFESFFQDTYLNYFYSDEDLKVNLINTNIEKRIKEFFQKNKAFVFMSGTLHSEKILKNIFGISEYEIVEAETILPGKVNILEIGGEEDCKYSNFITGKIKRERYLELLEKCVKKSDKPCLVHVNAFSDLPSEKEKNIFCFENLISKEKLLEIQGKDKTGKSISDFKNKKFEILYSTKCSRGIDFPGDSCISVIFTKYPNPSQKDIFWKVLKKTYPTYFWDFYKDKAEREFLQRLYRTLRSKQDSVFVLSPDKRVLNFLEKNF